MYKRQVQTESTEYEFDAGEFGLTQEATDTQILEAIADALLEKSGINIRDEAGGFIYFVKRIKSEDTGVEKVIIAPKAEPG